MATHTKVKFEGAVQAWGNSLGVRITQPICKLAHIERGDKVSIEVTEEGLLIKRKHPRTPAELPYTEAELLEDMTPHTAHADELPHLIRTETGD
jgi:antitoxin MazE